MRANSKDIPADAGSKAKLQASAREGPIILFSHGLRATSVLHQTLIEDLVSHGWTVAALDHPYDAVGVQFADPENKNNSEIIRSTVPAEYGDEILKEYLKVRVEDIGFAISALNARKVVVVGHSLGGSAAVEAALKWPKAIVGAFNMDGLMWIDKDAVEEGRKVLLMGAGEDPGRKGGWEEFMQAAKRSKTWAKEVSVKGVKHMGFSDLAWLGKLPFMEMIPALASYIEALGSADGDRMLEVARVWARDFAEFSVGKKGSGKLVKGGSGNGTWVDGWEDVIFIGGN